MCWGFLNDSREKSFDRVSLPYSSSQPTGASISLFLASSQSCNGLKYSNSGDASIFRWSVRISMASCHFTDEPNESISLKCWWRWWLNFPCRSACIYQGRYSLEGISCFYALINIAARQSFIWIARYVLAGLETGTLVELELNDEWHQIPADGFVRQVNTLLYKMAPFPSSKFLFTSNILHRPICDIWLLHQNHPRCVEPVVEYPNILVSISRIDNCIRLVWCHRGRCPIEIYRVCRQMTKILSFVKQPGGGRGGRGEKIIINKLWFQVGRIFIHTWYSWLISPASSCT